MTSNTSTYVAQVPRELFEKLTEDLSKNGFIFTEPPPPYSIFNAKKTGVSCTLYTSGKLVVQGKNMQEWIEFYLEPEVLQNFRYSHPLAHLDLTPRIGIDESGKGDLFGPLCTAGIYATSEQIQKLATLKVRDSKKLTDRSIAQLASKIEAVTTFHVIRIFPERYNSLYASFQNLNHLLAWCHATVIEVLADKTGCQNIIIDQFAAEHIVESALKKKQVHVQLAQRHRAEEDIVVAAASILARNAYLMGLEALSKEWEILLPKGASSLTISAAKEFVKKHGKEHLPFIAKMHFKSLDGIVERIDTNCKN